MDYIDIIYYNVKWKEIEQLLFGALQIKKDYMIIRNLYDNTREKMCKYSMDIDLDKQLTGNNIGCLYVCEDVNCGITIQDVVICFNFENGVGDVEINFPLTCIGNENKISDEKTISYSERIKQKFQLNKIRCGYEPGEDADMLIWEI